MEKDPSIYVVLDPSGDLQLVVNEGDKQKKFHTSSKAMSLASPVWQAKLDPSGYFMESRPENGQVALPDDDADAILIVLHIVHLRFRYIPNDITFQRLLSLSIVCDKHDTVEIIRPWFLNWQGLFDTSAWKPVDEELLFIAGT